MAGKSVTLIGENGLPRYQRSVLSPVALGPSPLGDQSCSFQSVDMSLLELLPDAGIDRYRIELDLRQISTGKNYELGSGVGFYFGYQEQTSFQKKNYRLMHTVRFLDFSNEPADKVTLKNCDFESHVMQTDSKRGTNPYVFYNASIQFEPSSDGRPGFWRHIIAEITPDELQIHWVDDSKKPVTFVRWTAARMKKEYRNIDAELLRVLSDDEVLFNDWNPRLPFGIFAYQAALSVRNVTITPLPDPSP